MIAVGNDGQWQRFCRVIGRDDLAADGRHAKVKGRLVGRDELVPAIAETLRARPTANWIERLEAEGIPCGPINNYRQVFADPQVPHRGLRVDIARSDGTSVPTVASPLRLMKTPPRYDLAPPLLGEHTDAVLKHLLHMDDTEIAALRAEKIV